VPSCVRFSPCCAFALPAVLVPPRWLVPFPAVFVSFPAPVVFVPPAVFLPLLCLRA
jgi:hypothetical protein